MKLGNNIGNWVGTVELEGRNFTTIAHKSHGVYVFSPLNQLDSRERGFKSKSLMVC